MLNTPCQSPLHLIQLYVPKNWYTYKLPEHFATFQLTKAYEIHRFPKVLIWAYQKLLQKPYRYL